MKKHQQKSKRALFITFEGGEGAGKTTLISSLQKELSKRGEEVVRTREPGGTPLGEEIRRLLLEGKQSVTKRAELLLFLASRAEHVDQLIKPSMEEGKIVLCDRFTDSTLAYQAFGRQFDLKEVETLALFATDGLIPDITFYIDIDPVIGLSRRKRATGTLDRMEGEDLSYHKKVREAFLNLAEKNKKRIKVLDGNKSRDELFKEALSVIDEWA